MIVAAGELLAEFISHQPDCGLSRTVEYSGPYASGAPAIFIDQAARVGARTHLYGCVGDDPFGKMLLNRLQSDGVGLDDVVVLPDTTTGTAFVSYFSNGERRFLFNLRGTSSEMMPDTTPPASPFTFHVSGASLGIPSLRKAVLRLAKAAVDSGGKVSCDPNVRVEILSDRASAKALDTILELSRIVLPSDADLAHLFPNLSPNEACNGFLQRGAEIVVLKRGSKGIEVYTQAGQFSIPAHDVAEVDPTGAGDCFCGAFIGLLDQGMPIEEAARFANAAGAMHVTQRGPMEGNPSLSEIQTFINGSEAVASY